MPTTFFCALAKNPMGWLCKVFAYSKRRVPTKKDRGRDDATRGEAIVKKITALSSSARPRRATSSFLSRQLGVFPPKKRRWTIVDSANLKTPDPSLASDRQGRGTEMRRFCSGR